MSFRINASALTACGLLVGCAAIPVQQTTLVNGSGGRVTCKQVGRGIVSYGVGKSIYEDCIAKADLPAFFGPFIAGEWPRSGWLMISST